MYLYRTRLWLKSNQIMLSPRITQFQTYLFSFSKKILVSSSVSGLIFSATVICKPRLLSLISVQCDHFSKSFRSNFTIQSLSLICSQIASSTNILTQPQYLLCNYASSSSIWSLSAPSMSILRLLATVLIFSLRLGPLCNCKRGVYFFSLLLP